MNTENKLSVLSLGQDDFIKLPTSELIKLSNKEIISVIGFVPRRVKYERSRLANITKCMPKNPVTTYFEPKKVVRRIIKH